MKKILILFFCLCIVLPTYAKEENSLENVEDAPQIDIQNNEDKNMDSSEQVEGNIVSKELLQKIDEEKINVNEERKPEIEVVHKLEKVILPMPDCEDKTLKNKVEEYIKNYFDKVSNTGTLHRRRRYFVLHNLDKFQKENIANYQTSATRPISDIIAKAKVNFGLIDENMLLCKNTGSDRFAGNIYMLVYPYESGYKVELINLASKQNQFTDTSFTYK